MKLRLRKISSNLLVFSILVVIIFVGAHVFLPLQLVNAMSDNFNKIAIGLAALITAYFGSSYFREELSRRRSIKSYREKYPPQLHGKTYKFIESEKTPGAIFLLDLKTKHKHHVWNMKTMYDMGWQIYLPAEQLPNEKFLSYVTGESIRTRGELGE